ncbi:MAG: ABC transporter substrate-binding protein [Anaerolineales bacterium]|jgi:oligopeptide transport system substrate-binding protein
MRKKLLAIASLLMIASFILGACAQQPATPQVIEKTVQVEVTKIVAGTPQTETKVITATPAPTEAAPAGPKVLHLNFGAGDVPTIDPSLTTDTSSVQVVEETSVGLSRLDETTSVTQPGMATSWDVSEDGKTYTFHLRTDVPWVKYDSATGQVVKVQDCNGNDRMVTAQDFAYGFLRTLDPATASPYAYVLAFAVQGAADYNSGKNTDPSSVAIKVIDDATLEITFNEAAAYDPTIAGMWVGHAEPSWLIDGDDCTQAAGDRWTETGFQQSYGPYTLKEWVHDSTLTIIKNPFWPGSDNIPQAKIDEVTWTMLDTPPAFADYEAGNLDVSLVPLSDIDRVKADPTLSKELKITPALCTYYYGFNTKAKFVDDQRVRLALSESVDRQSLIDNVTKGGQEPAHWFSRPGLAGAPTMDNYPDLGVKYDPTDAKAQLQSYLDEKGLTADQLDITLMYNTSAGHQAIAEAIQQMWKDNLGVNVKLVNQEWKVFLTTIRSADTPQIFRLGWCADYPDANNFLKEDAGYGGSANPPGGGFNWKNDQFEQLLTQAALETDPQKRTDLYAQAEEILVKTDAAMIPIYWYTNVYVTKPYVQRTYAASPGQEHIEKWDITAH